MLLTWASVACVPLLIRASKPIATAAVRRFFLWLSGMGSVCRNSSIDHGRDDAMDN
jgi:hypothetical protein